MADEIFGGKLVAGVLLCLVVAAGASRLGSLLYGPGSCSSAFRFCPRPAPPPVVEMPLRLDVLGSGCLAGVGRVGRVGRVGAGVRGVDGGTYSPPPPIEESTELRNCVSD